MKNILAAFFSLALVLPAYAQVTSSATSTPLRAPREGVRQEIQNARIDVKKQIEATRENTRKRIESEKEDFRKTIEIRRAELQTKIKTSREELKTKLENIKDERKKTAVRQIDQNIAYLNSRMTAHYVNVLDQMSDVLKRIVSRTDTAQANGKDVAAVRTAITNAQNAIAAARAAVAIQAGKVYSINISSSTTDTTLKSDVGVTRQALRDDLKKTGDSIKAAREAVRQAAVTLAQIRGVDELKAPTSTATSTTTTTSQ